MVMNGKGPVAGLARPKFIESGMPVVTGSLLATFHAELSEMFGEMVNARLTLAAVDRLCATRPELRTEIIAEVGRIQDEQASAAASKPARRRR